MNRKLARVPDKGTFDCSSSWAHKARNLEEVKNRLPSSLLQANVTVQIGHEGGQHFGDERRGGEVELQLSDLFDYDAALRAGGSHFLIDRGHFYASQVELSIDDKVAVELAKFVDVYGGCVQSCNLWLNVTACHTNEHYDSRNNILFVICGRKTVRIRKLSGGVAKQLHPVWSDFANHVKGGVGGEVSDAGEEFVVVAGEFVFIPEGWLHEVQSDAGSLAVNIWFDDETSIERLCATNPEMLEFYLRSVARHILEREEKARRATRTKKRKLFAGEDIDEERLSSAEGVREVVEYLEGEEGKNFVESMGEAWGDLAERISAAVEIHNEETCRGLITTTFSMT